MTEFRRLYMISLPDKYCEKRYDFYDSVIICAKSKEEAVTIHPNECEWCDNTWISMDKINELKVVEIGLASDLVLDGVVHSSFVGGWSY